MKVAPPEFGVKRRHFLGLSTALVASISGCASDAQNEAVTTYTDGYRQYKIATETHPVAADASENQSEWFERTAKKYGDAQNLFSRAAKLCEEDSSREICEEAAKKADLKANMASQQAGDNTQRALILDQRSNQYSIAHPDEFSQSVSFIARPGNTTVGPISPASLDRSQREAENRGLRFVRLG